MDINLTMINKFNDHFILIDKCAEQTRIVEILNHKIVKFIAWFDTTPPLIGSVYDAVIIKKLNGGVVRAKIKDKRILSVRGVPKSLDVNNKIKIIITSEEFEDKPIQARILLSNSKKYENLDDVQRIIDLFFTKNIPIIEDIYAIYWDILDLDKEFIGALQPKIELSEGGRIWIEKTRAATLIDIDTHKLLLNSEEEILDFCNRAFVRCIQEIKLRNIGGMIVIDFPRMSQNRKKNLHENITKIGKQYFFEGNFLGFSRLVLYEMYIPRNLPSLESFYVDSNAYSLQNHLRSLWRKSKELKSKKNVQFLCGTNLFKNLKTRKVPSFINIVKRSDLPEDYGELMETNI